MIRRLSSTKPPLGCPVNMGHPLARGLIAATAFNEGAGGPYALPTRKFGSLSTSLPTWRAKGLFMNAANAQYVDVPGSAGTGRYLSVMLRFVRHTNQLATERIIDNPDADNSSLLTRNTSGTYDLAWPRSISGGLFTIADSNAAIGMAIHNFTITFDFGVRWGDGDTLSFPHWYVNGQEISKTIVSNGDGTQVARSGLRLGGIAAAARSIDGYIVQYACWDRALTANEALWLAREPYAFYAQSVRRLIVATAAATGISPINHSSIGVSNISRSLIPAA